MPKQDNNLRDAVIGCGIILYLLQELSQLITQVFYWAILLIFVLPWRGWYKLVTLRNAGEGGGGAKFLATVLMLLTLAIVVFVPLLWIGLSSSHAVVQPTTNVTSFPTATPTTIPSGAPTDTPTATPSDTPTATPTTIPSDTPTDTPTATPSDTPTTTPSDISYAQATSGTPVLDDPLNDNSQGNAWNIDNHCGFTGGEYHVTNNQSNSFEVCFAAPTFNNFAFQVQMTILQGDGGGIVFRTGGANAFGYRFFLGLNYFDLHYGNTLLASSSSFRANLNQTYLLTAIAVRNTISLYLDKQLVTTVEDNSASSGDIGLMAVDFSNNADVAFSNAQVWNL